MENLGGVCMKDLFVGVAWVAAFLVFIGWLTAPADDQVCRMSRNWLAETLHGTGSQPTCQSLIDRIEAKASHADAKAAELEERLANVESRLRM